MSSRFLVRLAVIAVLAPMSLLVACGDSSGESTLPNLESLQFGDPAESLYCLPYPDGATYSVNNTYSTPGSHIGRFAYDFALPFASQIAAARAGTVVESRDQYGDDEAIGGHENGVFVVHDDGAMAAYLHMSEDGVFVDVGDEVAVGDALGVVGTSGTSPDNPHLLFEVFEGQGEGAFSPIPALGCLLCVSRRPATTAADAPLRDTRRAFPFRCSVTVQSCALRP